MAQGRMLRRETCESNSFAALDDTRAQLLCCLLTPWWDDHGKMIGDPQWIKGNIVRKLKQYTEKEISRCLQLINDTLDVQWWTDDQDDKWLYWSKFDKYQTIAKEKKTKDNLPSPKIPKNPQKTSSTREEKLREVNIREGKVTATAIYSYYSKTIKPGAEEDAIKNIAKLLKTGFSKEDLVGRIDAYKAKLVKDGTEERFFIQANNFFGKAARYKDFAPKENKLKPADPNCPVCKDNPGWVFNASTSSMDICKCRLKK